MEVEEKQEESQDESKDPILALAEKMGYNPNFEGENAVDPETYILRAQEVNRTSSKQIEKLKEKVDSIQTSFRDMAMSQSKEMVQALKNQRETLLSEQKRAVSEGDVEGFEKTSRELETTGQRLSELEKPDPTTDQARHAEFAEGLRQFKDKHKSWYEKRPRATLEANLFGQTLLQNNPDISPEDFYAKVEEAMMEDHPELFSKPSNKPTAVSGDKPPAKKNEGKYMAQLLEKEPEAELVFKQQVAAGRFKAEDSEKWAEEILRDW